MSGLADLLDDYGRVARLYPGLLCLLPLLLLLTVTATELTKSLAGVGVMVAAGLALVYFVAVVARSRGQRVEARLMAGWGGWTSTLMLRHSDARVDAVTKARYHRKLEGFCPGLTLPTAAGEAADLAAADDLYRSATKALIERRRGNEWELLLQENAGYGFRRNMLGLKPIAIGLLLILTIGTAILWWYLVGSPPNVAAALAVAGIWPAPFALVLVDLVALSVWIFFVTPGWVHQASLDYCNALFRTLDAA